MSLRTPAENGDQMMWYKYIIKKRRPQAIGKTLTFMPKKNRFFEERKQRSKRHAKKMPTFARSLRTWSSGRGGSPCFGGTIIAYACSAKVWAVCTFLVRQLAAGCLTRAASPDSLRKRLGTGRISLTLSRNTASYRCDYNSIDALVAPRGLNGTA